MSWLRFSDDFTDWQEWDHASTDARWGYVCLVAACSRGQFWDGVLPKRRALAALSAYVNDPQGVIERLAMLSLVHEDKAAGTVRLPRADEHLPSAEKRAHTERDRLRMRVNRAHARGDHSMCRGCEPVVRLSVPANVPDGVPRNVPDSVGTGRDGTGKALPAPESDDK